MGFSNLYHRSVFWFLSAPIFIKIMGTGVVVTVIFGVVMLYQIQTCLSRTLYDSLEERAESLAVSLAMHIERPLILGDYYAVKECIEKAMKNKSGLQYIIVEGSNKEIIAHTFIGQVPEDLVALRAGTSPGDDPVEVFEYKEGLIFEAAISLLGGKAGQVRVGMIDNIVTNEQSSMIWGLILTLTACMIIGLVLVLLLSISLRRPAQSLLLATNRVKDGDFNIRARIHSRDEIGDLAVAFNHMTEKLGQTRAELREKTAEALKAEKLAAIGETITGIAHCVKNMLNGLQGGFYLLKTDIKKRHGEVPELGFRMLNGNLTRLSALVQDMLTYSIDRQPEYELTNLNELVGSVVDLMRTRAQKQKVLLKFQPEQNIADVEIDSKGIYRSVLNLVCNALEASKEGADVFVSTYIEGDEQVVVEVTDHGIGMDQKTLSSIFKLFFSKKGSEGTGLGLTVTRKIIHEHGGRIEVESESGIGSTFRVYLPTRRAAQDGDMTSIPSFK